MPKLSEVEVECHEHVEVKGLSWFSASTNHHGLICGGIYLLSGPPGSGKTTLALQVACDVAASGRKVLYVAMEQSASDVKKKVQQQILPSLRSNGRGPGQERFAITETAEGAIGSNLYVDSEIAGVESLLDCLVKRVLPDTAVY
jgi:predicted ATP-dependent serine protease